MSMPNSIPHRTLQARIWEDGTFGISNMKMKGMEPKHYDEWAEAHRGNAENIARLREEYTEEQFEEYYKDAFSHIIDAFPPFGLSNVPNSHIPASIRSRRGLGGITSLGKKMVRNACLRLEREKPDDLAFLTLTLPNISAAEALNVAANWPEIIRYLNQQLGRMLKDAGLSDEIVSVTEVQKERFDKTGVFALHYHACFVGRKSRYFPWVIGYEDIRSYWRKIISKYLTMPATAYFWDACESIVKVRKSLSGYMGKYLSKGLGHDQASVDAIHPDILAVYPSAWWNCTLSLRARVNKHTEKPSEAHNQLLLRACSQGDWDRYFYWIKPITLSGEGSFVVMGWAGCLKPGAWHDIIGVLPCVEAYEPL